MDPGVCSAGLAADFNEWVKSAGVNVACLQNQQRVAVEFRQQVCAHPSLFIGRHLNQSVLAQPQNRQGFVYGGVSAGAEHDPDLRCAEQSARADIPAVFSQQVIASGDQAAQAGSRGAADEPCRCILR